MTASNLTAPRRPGTRRAGGGRLPTAPRVRAAVARLARVFQGPRMPRLARGSAALLGAVALLALAGCGGHGDSHRAGGDPSTAGDSAGSAADTVRSLGAVPIPRPPSAQATPTADEHHLQLVAMGYAVNVRLPGAQAVVRASGPTEDLPATPGAQPLTRTTGTITVTLDHVTGALTVRASDFSSHDENGRQVPLRAVGPATATATAGHPAGLTLRGTFASGAAELTWRHDHRVITVWDFNVELD